MNTADLKSFHYLENGQIQFSLFDTIKSTKKLDSGFHNISYNLDEKRIVLTQLKSIEPIKIHDFPDKDKLDELFKAFFDERIRLKVSSLGFMHKVGVLLYGKEGTGKTTIIKHYANKAVLTKEAIVFYVGKHYLDNCWEFIRQIRNIQKNPIIVIMEEVEEIFKYGYEGTLKTIMDGNLSIDNCVFFGATNYIDKIPDAVKNRESRYKHVLDIEGIQNPDDIVRILTPLIFDLFKPEEITTFANTLKGSTLDIIKQFAMDKIMDLKTYKKEKRTIGFKI